MLLKLINSQYEGLYDNVVKPQYMQLLQNYTQNPKQNWKNKIAAINLIFSTIIKNFSTQCNLFIRFFDYYFNYYSL